MAKRVHDPQQVRAAIQLMGGPVEAAKKLDVARYQTIQSWVKSGVPVEYAAEVERHTAGAFSRRQVWPEKCRRIWPDLNTDSAQSEPVQ